MAGHTAAATQQQINDLGQGFGELAGAPAVCICCCKSSRQQQQTLSSTCWYVLVLLLHTGYICGCLRLHKLITWGLPVLGGGWGMPLYCGRYGAMFSSDHLSPRPATSSGSIVL
jgi:hypothetical protein